MVTFFQWEDHEIELRSVPRAKYGYLGVDTEVWVDGQKEAVSGGIKFQEEATGTITHNNEEVPFRSEIYMNGLELVGNYKFYINDELISSGKLYLKWWKTLLCQMAGIVVGLVGGTLIGAFIGFLIALLFNL